MARSGQHLAFLSKLDDNGRTRAILVGLLSLALALRLTVALILPPDYLFGDSDATEYVDDAKNLLTLGVFGEEPGVPYAAVPPGYPLFLAAIFALTDYSIFAVRFVQVILAMLSVWITYRIGSDVASERTGRLAALILAAGYPAWIAWPSIPVTETLYTFLLLLFVGCLLKSLDNPTAGFALLSGATFALTLLTREVLLAFPLLLPLVLYWTRMSWTRALRYVLLFGVAALVVVSPWLARNYRTFRHVFYTERTAALRYQLTGRGYLAPRYKRRFLGDPDVSRGSILSLRPGFYLRACYRYLKDDQAPTPSPPDTWPAMEDRYGESGDILDVSLLLGDPTAYGCIVANRLIETWLHPKGYYSLPRSVLLRAFYLAWHVALLALGGLGLVLGRKRQRRTGVRVIALLLAYAAGTFLLSGGINPRYPMPFLPFIFISAAMTIEKGSEPPGGHRVIDEQRIEHRSSKSPQ